MTGTSSLLTRLVAVAAVANLFVDLVAISVDAAFDVRDGAVAGEPGAAAVFGARNAPVSIEGTVTAAETVTSDVAGPAGAPLPQGAAGEAPGGPRPPAGVPPLASTTPSAELIAGRGVDDDAIAIGIQYNTEINYSAFGASAASSGDQRAMSQAIADAINDAGGIAGRRVSPVFHETDPLTGTFAQHNQEACADLAEDNEVFAVLGTSNGLDEPSCLARHDTIYLTHKRTFQDQAMFDDFPSHFFMPGRMSATRWGAAVVDGLAAQGYFDGATVGVLRYDTAEFERLMAEVVRPRFAAHGVTIRDEVAITDATSTAVLGNIGAELANAVLRFRADGVDHVMFVEGGGILPFLFFPEAENQGYRPVYGLHSANLPQFHEPDQPEQLRRSMGVGWMPAEDVNFEHDPGDVARTDECVAILSAAGFEFADRIGFSVALGYCDLLLFLDSVLETTSDWTSDGFRTAVEALGASHRSAHTFATWFGPGRHDGPAVVRGFSWVDDCSCFTYTGPPQEVG